jgi:methionyl aminopeptidase
MLDYSIPISQQFPDKVYPMGEIMDHPGDFNMKRTSNAEYRDRLYDSLISNLRKAAECHRQVRKMA